MRKKARGKNVYTVHVQRLKAFVEPLTDTELEADEEARWDVPLTQIDPELRNDIEDGYSTRSGGGGGGHADLPAEGRTAIRILPSRNVYK